MKRAIRKYWKAFVSLVALFALSLGIAGYILVQQRFRFPLLEDKPMILKAELDNAQAVTPGQGQTVRVAGVEIGKIGKVELEDGLGVVELQIDKEYEGLIRADATALLRPKTGLKDMLLEVDPGEGRPLAEGERIRVQSSAPDVNPDEVLRVLDTDARDYLKLLIVGAGKGLRGRGNDLRETLRRLEPLHRDLARVNGALARRRASLERLVHDYGLLTRELGGRDRELTRLVRASSVVFRAFASESGNISASVAKLPGALRRTERTLAKVDTLGGELRPALEALRVPIRRLAETNALVRPFALESTPVVRDRIRPFTRVAQPYVRDLSAAARDLTAATPDLTKAVGRLNRFFNIGAYNPGGSEGLTGDLARDRARREGFLYWLAWTTQNTVSLHNTGDARSVFRRVTSCGLSPGALAPVIADLVAAGIPLNTVLQGLNLSQYGVCVF